MNSTLLSAAVAAAVIQGLVGCSYYMKDDAVSFKPIANDRETSQFQFWVGYRVARSLGGVARSLGEPPYAGAQALVESVLNRNGKCLHGARVVPSSFHDPGTWGLAFVAECKMERMNQDVRKPVSIGSASEP